MTARQWRLVALSVAVALMSGIRSEAGLFGVAESPKVTSSTLIPVGNQVVETFDGFSPSDNVPNLNTNVGTLTSPRGAVVATTDPTFGQYGGAIGSVNYYAIGDQSRGGPTATLQLAGPVTYFGMLWSAVDDSDRLEFFNGAVSLGVLTGASVTAALSGNPLYYGNPSTGQDPGEIFAFINFFADGGDSFDRVEFTNGPSTGFEVDNFTLDRTQAVPEPTSLAMLATGLVMGAGYARRRLRPAR